MKRLTTIILLIFKFSYGTQVLNVPFIKQKDDFCGPAALSSVFSFYGVDIPQEEIAKYVYIKQLKGALITDLENYAKKQGFKTILKNSNIDEIKTFIDRGIPVIALTETGFWLISSPHYIVITGYNGEGIIANTGYEYRKIIPYREFEKRWEKLGNTILVIYR